jgi:hypothetical protein
MAPKLRKVLLDPKPNKNVSYFLLRMLTIPFKLFPFSHFERSFHITIDLIPARLYTRTIMSWHSYSTNPSTTQEQNQEPSEEAKNKIVSNTYSILEYPEFDPSFGDLEPFAVDHLFDFLPRYCPPSTTSSNPGNAPPTQSFQTASGEINPNNIQPSNCSRNHLINDR